MSRITQRLDLMTHAEIETMRREIDGGYHYPGKESDLEELKREQDARLPMPAKNGSLAHRQPIRYVE